jgi:multidrug efflux system membrane fusion protein
VNALGVVTPLKTVAINSRVQGQIVAVKYQEGQMVKAGDPLLEIDPGPSQAAVTQQEGQLTRDIAILQDAKLDLERYQEAFASNAIPKQQLDTQIATVQQDQGTVKLDQGLLDNANVQLAYCHITAPISGRVGLRLVDEGNMVQANGTTALVVITQLQPITVIFNVAEDDLPQILEQLRAGKTLTVDAFDRAQTKKLATGTLETLDNQIDPTTGTIKFRAVFTNDDEALFPNQFVNARLLVNTQEGVTLLSNAVIQRNSEGAFVYVVTQDQNSSAQTNTMGTGTMETNANMAGNSPPESNAGDTNSSTGDTNSMKAGGARNYPTGTVSMKTITAGTTDGNVTAVDGIDPGTVVAADSFNKLTDGAKVAIRPSAAGGTGGASGGKSGKGGHHKKPQSQQENPQPQPEQ